MVNRVLSVVGLVWLVVFCLAWWPAIFALLGVGCLMLAVVRARNERGAGGRQ